MSVSRVLWINRIVISPALALVLCLMISVGVAGGDDGNPLLTSSFHGRMSGYTKDSNYDPLPGVTVYCDSWYGRDSTESGADGYYSISFYRDDTDYLFYAMKPGWHFSTSEYLKDWELFDGMHYTHQFTGTWEGLIISGHIRDTNGVPLAGLEVGISGDSLGQDYTDADGLYEFSKLDPGTYTVTPTVRKWMFFPASKEISLSDSYKHNQDFFARLSFDPVSVKHDDPGAIGFEILPPETGTVTVRIVSPRGRIVWQTERNVEADRSATIPWPGHNSDGLQVASGVYIASITGAGCTSIKRVVILR
jgi:hypothetical protein